MNRCSDRSLKGCSAGLYFICSAYKEEKNCWEAKAEDYIACCKRKDKSRCPECDVWKKAKEQGIIKEEEN